MADQLLSGRLCIASGCIVSIRAFGFSYINIGSHSQKVRVKGTIFALAPWTEIQMGLSPIFVLVLKEQSNQVQLDLPASTVKFLPI
jgi:hypothetical protein